MIGRIHWWDNPNSDQPRIIVTDDLQRWSDKLTANNEHFIVYPGDAPIPRRK